MKTIECKNPDCHEVRMKNEKAGTYLTYCEKHQREYWREHSGSKHPNKNVLKQHPGLIASAGDNGTAVEAAHAETAAKTSRLSDEDRQRIIDGVRARVLAKEVAAPAPARTEVPVSHSGDTLHEELQKQIDDSKEIVRRARATTESAKVLVATSQSVRAEHQCANGCDNCVYRDVVELLEKNMPGVRGLIDSLKTIRGMK